MPNECGLIASLFLAGCVGLMALAGIGAANQQSAFTVECEAAKPRFECGALWAAAHPPAPVVIVTQTR